MSRFTEFTGITLATQKKDKRITIKPMCFEVWQKWSKEVIVVPQWFEFDGASVPRLLRSLIPPTEPSTILAVCLHDWLYHIKGRQLDYYNNNKINKISKNYSRIECDTMFYDALIAQGNSKLKCEAMFIGVSLFGRVYRNKNPTHDFYLPVK